MKQLKILKDNFIIYLIGSLGYSAIELMWRGMTHWTMSVTGGVCFVFIYNINIKFKKTAVWLKCLLGSGIITAVEFSVGYIVNIILKWNVWDYAGRPGNIMGQVCPLYTFLWFLLCIPLNKFSLKIKDKLNYSHIRRAAR